MSRDKKRKRRVGSKREKTREGRRVEKDIKE